MIQFNNSYASLPAAFYQKTEPRSELKPKLLYFNDALAHDLGLNTHKISAELLANYFSFNIPIPDSTPIAMAYAGHQFGHFVPQLGDGRATLLGEIIASDNKRYDIHLKGSGQTPFSRRGDGKSALGPSIRECLISEAMFHLHVPTTRTLAVTRTSEMVIREKLLPGGVSTRVALSHMRVGTFEYFAAKGDTVNLKVLADYAIARLYPKLQYGHQPYLNFWKEVFHKQIQVVAKWMSIGFIHGVMNTDNMNISGETIDYGPCAFMDQFSHLRVFSSIDQNGRYAYANQPQILFWNMARFAESISSLIEISFKELESEFLAMQETYHKEYTHQMLLKFGIQKSSDAEINQLQILIKQWLDILENNQLDFTLSYIDLERYIQGLQTHTNLEQFSEFPILAQQIQKVDSPKNLVNTMQQHNPMIIPRNHNVEAAIQSSIQGDDQKFMTLMSKLSTPFTRVEELNEFCKPPKDKEKNFKTFCGT